MWILVCDLLSHKKCASPRILIVFWGGGDCLSSSSLAPAVPMTLSYMHMVALVMMLLIKLSSGNLLLGEYLISYGLPALLLPLRHVQSKIMSQTLAHPLVPALPSSLLFKSHPQNSPADLPAEPNGARALGDSQRNRGVRRVLRAVRHSCLWLRSPERDLWYAGGARARLLFEGGR